MSLKNTILKKHAQHRYPQYLFGKAAQDIATTHKTQFKLREIKILDAPCGTGETTYHLAQVNGSTVTGIDAWEPYLAQANSDFGAAPNVYFYKQDIFEHLKTFVGFYDVINIINSLFLFKEAEKLLMIAKKSLTENGKLVVIIPNTESQNFLDFQKNDANKTNKSVYTREQIVVLFEKCGFEIAHLQGLAYTSHVVGTPFQQKLSIAKDYFLLVKDALQKTKGTRPPSYWLFVLTQNNKK